MTETAEPLVAPSRFPASNVSRVGRALASFLAIGSVLAAGLTLAWYLQFVFAGPSASLYVEKIGPGAKLIPAGQLNFDGESFSCGALPTVLQPGFQDYGAAYFGFIILNPERFSTLPVTLKRFAFSHECGHQFVGYSETAADCYAVGRGLRDGWLGRESLEEICSFFVKSKGSVFHLPGPLRCSAIRECYKNRGGP